MARPVPLSGGALATLVDSTGLATAGDIGSAGGATSLGVAEGAGDGKAVGAGEHAVEDDAADFFRAAGRCGEP